MSHPQNGALRARVRRASAGFALAVAAVMTTAACSAVHSDAVRELITLEGQKITGATTEMKKFRAETDERVKALRAAQASLDTALRQQQASEHVHALIFSSNQNLSTKSGVDAHAVTYMIGQIYLSEHIGLEKKVRDQFEEDYRTLTTLTERLATSWQSIQKLHGEVEAFAKKSALASVDAGLLKAVAEQAPGASQQLDAALKQARRVNDVVDKVIGGRVRGGETAQQVRSVTQDLIDLVERVKK
jgi:hypothetical protein